MMRGSSKAIRTRPDPQDAEAFGRVLRFEPRRPGEPPRECFATEAVEDDADEFARFELEQDGPIDYRQRMIMNLIALAIVILLVGLGVWIADTISDLQRKQDCLLQGRSNCAPIEVALPLGE